jgi:predicted dehydrogenase
MSENDVLPVLRIGLVGSGFIAGFHLQALMGVRNCTVTGVYSTTSARREALAQRATGMGLGAARPFASLEEMIRSDTVDALWILAPNYTRLEHMREIHRVMKAGRTSLRAVACEKPLARTVAEAREMLRLAEDVGLNHGYLENQIFSTAVLRGKEIIWRRAVPRAGRPYLARAAEEHGGPHEPWFWQGDKQGGGVLSDMMCHSVEVARFLLTEPGAPRDSLKLLSANGTVANLKWTQPRYVQDLQQRSKGEVDFSRRPVEDFARATIRLAAADGQDVMIEATTSWAYVGAGLRIQLELLGPEYAMEFSSLSTGLKVFMSRAVTGGEGEDLIEKQNAEQGLMPVVEDEPGIYGYTEENRHFVECFRTGREPIETFRDGVEVVRMLMALYRSAETGCTVKFDDEDLETYVPLVARPEAAV